MSLTRHANPLRDAPAALDTAGLTAPGVPKNYPDAKKLVTEDCIQPGADDKRGG